ncbi:atp synthase subunit alpha [Fusarium flagelliforme]|uniref:Atp synthase subunit alpha n=1 Tax=Fusarium flagelliforme TaxID=2675880 RepID=A0A395M9F3_9HYPO|nr:atp synthase subunit alpha [Fusarium flagelliforme]
MASDDEKAFDKKLTKAAQKDRLRILQRKRDEILDAGQQHNYYHKLFFEKSDLYADKVQSLVEAGCAETEDDEEWGRFLCLATNATSLGALRDWNWVYQVQCETRDWLQQNRDTNTHRHAAVRETLAVLKDATYPSPEEALFCTPETAATLVDADTILVVQDQQPFNWGGKPMERLFRDWTPKKLHDKKITVTILDSPTSHPPIRHCTLKDIKRKFTTDFSPHERWNVLDIRNDVPVPRPEFLPGKNCLLLNEFRELDKRLVRSRTLDFILLSEGGNYTPMHVDPFGLATFITVQQGEVGFGWIMDAKTQDYLDIHKTLIPNSLKEKTRYMVLRPGQTVFMPSGTIHFIFRKNDTPTLATGGHVLTWKSILKWLRVMKIQELSTARVDKDVTAKETKAYIDVLTRVLRNHGYHGLVPRQDGYDAVWNVIKNWDTLTMNDEAFMEA